MSGAGTRTARTAADPRVLSAQVELLRAAVDTDESEVIERALHLAMDLTGSRTGHAFYIGPDQNSARTAGRVPSDASAPDDRVWQQALLHREPRAVDPPGADGRPTTYLSVPVMEDGGTPLVFALEGSDGALGETAAKMAQAVADSAWTAVARGRQVRALKERLNLLSTRQSVMGMATWEWDPAGDEVTWDPAVSMVVPGLCPECNSWAPLRDLLDESSAQTLSEALAAGEAFSLELSGATADRQPIRLLLQGRGEQRPDRQSPVFRGTLMDVSVVAALEDAHRKATHDVLTGLPNRAWLLDELNERVSRPQQRREDQFAVFFIDLDDFKAVNDEFGHIVGDEVLSVCARRIEQAARDREAVARFGGDEFVMIQDGPFTWQSVEAVAHRIRAAVGRPLRVGQHLTQVGVSIGVALCASDQWTSTELLRHADEALLEAKKATWGVVIRDDRGTWDA